MWLWLPLSHSCPLSPSPWPRCWAGHWISWPNLRCPGVFCQLWGEGRALGLGVVDAGCRVAVPCPLLPLFRKLFEVYILLSCVSGHEAALSCYIGCWRTQIVANSLEILVNIGSSRSGRLPLAAPPTILEDEDEEEEDHKSQIYVWPCPACSCHTLNS